MGNITDKSATASRSVNPYRALNLWILFLSLILIPAAIIVNFNIGDSLFRSQLADWLAHNQAVAAADTNTQR
jgi:hypothetical protein